jgi:uncharacterized protein YjbI with pentapeptide repeats
MANEEHLAILKQGVETWNAWIDENKQVASAPGGFFTVTNEVMPDLSSASLYGLDLRRFKLRNANLSNADLRDTNLEGADLSRANLTKANISGAKLSGAYMRSANLSNANLSGANLETASLMKANMRETNLNGANLGHAALHEVELSGADLRGAQLLNVFLIEATLIETKMVGASLIGTNLFSADLRNADLSSADLRGANLDKAKLGGANLSGASLGGAHLNNASLDEANLSNASLVATSFLNADLERAVLTGACIQEWNINSATNLAHAQCEYIYQKSEYASGKWQFLNRLPKDPNATFNSGEFEILIRKVLQTIDLIFPDGIDWQAFFQSFQELRTQYRDDEITIQAIERKGSDFVIRLETVADADRQGAIETSVKDLYKRNLQELKAQVDEYKELFREERQQRSELQAIVKILAEKQQAINQTTINTQTVNAVNSGSGTIETSTQNINQNEKS